MDAPSQRTPAWSTAQAYVVAVCCLLLGATVGYVLRSSGSAPASTVSQQAHPAVPQGAQQPTPEQMQRVAEEQVKPLLAKLQTNGNDPELLANIALSYYAARQFPTAATYYERAVAAKPSADNLVSLGTAYFYSNEPDKALAAFQRALTFDPGSANALFNIGVIKWQVQNDPQGAVDAWQKLLKANPNHPRRAQVEEMIAKAKEHLGRTSPSNSAKPTS